MSLKTEILESLGIYMYLTKHQLDYLCSTSVSDKTFYSTLKVLRSKEIGLIRTQRFAYNPKKGSLGDLHMLSTKGAKYLSQQLKRQKTDIRFPKGFKGIGSDYYHRVQTIWIQILLSQHVTSQNIHLDFYHQYFQSAASVGHQGKYGGNNISTKIPIDKDYIISDSICQIGKQDRKLLLTIEMHNSHDVLRIYKQLLCYGKILSQGSISKKYHLKSPAKVMVVFEHLSTLKTTIERMQTDIYFTYLLDYFLFVDYKKLLENKKPEIINGNGMFIQDLI